MKLLSLQLFLCLLPNIIVSQNENTTSVGDNPQPSSNSSQSSSNSSNSNSSSPGSSNDSSQSGSISSNSNSQSNDKPLSSTQSDFNSSNDSSSSDSSSSNGSSQFDSNSSSNSNGNSDNSSSSNSTQSGTSSSQAQGSLTLLSPQRTQYTPVMIAIGTTVNFTWEYNIKPSHPVGGFSLIAIRTTPSIVTYPIATNLSASTFTYSWNTQDYNNDPNTVNILIADNNYQLYIFDSNHAYNYAATFGQLMPFVTTMSVYQDQTPSTQFVFSSSLHSSDYKLIILNMMIILATILI